MKIEIESYSVIYSFDTKPKDMDYYRPQHKELWNRTEKGQSEILPDRLEDWMHEKYVGILDPKQFKSFVEDMRLFAEKVKTMGSLGAPGHGLGHVPAISFTSETRGAYLNAYVTPNIDVEKLPFSEKEFNEKFDGDPKQLWETVRKQVIDRFGI